MSLDLSLPWEEKLKLESWGLPDYVLAKYVKKGVRCMFPWQVECLISGNVLTGGNLIYSAPTSAGKTLVAEILTLQTVLERKKKVIIILPFVSVVREKMLYFKELLAGSGIRVDGFMGSYCPPGGFRAVHVAICTIEKANSLINRLLEERSFENVGCVVVDELHLLGDPHRGYLLELLLTKIRYICKIGLTEMIQIVGMSATLPNLDLLASWLDATLYTTEFRPIPLYEYIKVNKKIYKSPGNYLSHEITPEFTINKDSGDVIYLCIDTILKGYSVLVFCPTKNWCETLAQQISVEIKKLGCSQDNIGLSLREQLNSNKISIVLEQLKKCPAGLEKSLGRSVSFGVGFHHAGLTMDERDIIEGAFRKNVIRVIVATSTLSAGVNLPARRVIVRTPLFNGRPMDILTYRQMIGRAGRMGKDTEGESYLICSEEDKYAGLQIVNSNLPAVESCLGQGDLSNSLKRAILEIIASGIVTTKDQIRSYASCTLLAQSFGIERLDDVVTLCLDSLQDQGFLAKSCNSEDISASSLAEACFAASIPPDQGIVLTNELARARKCFVLETDLHALYQVIPFSVCDHWEIDWVKAFTIWESLHESVKKIGYLIGVEERFLIKAMRSSINVRDNAKRISVLKRFYTALALQDLVNEHPLHAVAEKYGCNKGMLQSLQQSASTFAGMVTNFCHKLSWGALEVVVAELGRRIQFGVQRDLLDLMRLDCMTAVLARGLFNSGIKTLSELACSNLQAIQNAIRKAMPYQNEAVDLKDSKDICLPGRPGLSDLEAADIFIHEARAFLSRELGVVNIEWNASVSSSFYESSTLHNSWSSVSSRSRHSFRRKRTSKRKSSVLSRAKNKPSPIVQAKKENETFKETVQLSEEIKKSDSVQQNPNEITKDGSESFNGTSKLSKAQISKENDDFDCFSDMEILEEIKFLEKCEKPKEIVINQDKINSQKLPNINPSLTKNYENDIIVPGTQELEIEQKNSELFDIDFIKPKTDKNDLKFSNCTSVFNEPFSLDSLTENTCNQEESIKQSIKNSVFLENKIAHKIKSSTPKTTPKNISFKEKRKWSLGSNTSCHSNSDIFNESPVDVKVENIKLRDFDDFDPNLGGDSIFERSIHEEISYIPKRRLSDSLVENSPVERKKPCLINSPDAKNKQKPDMSEYFQDNISIDSKLENILNSGETLEKNNKNTVSNTFLADAFEDSFNGMAECLSETLDTINPVPSNSNRLSFRPAAHENLLKVKKMASSKIITPQKRKRHDSFCSLDSPSFDVSMKSRKTLKTTPKKERICKTSSPSSPVECDKIAEHNNKAYECSKLHGPVGIDKTKSMTNTFLANAFEESFSRIEAVNSEPEDNVFTTNKDDSLPYMPETAEKRLLNVDQTRTTPKKRKRYNSGKSPAKYPSLGTSVVKLSKTPNTTPTKEKDNRVLNESLNPSVNPAKNENKLDKIVYCKHKIDLDSVMETPEIMLNANRKNSIDIFDEEHSAPDEPIEIILSNNRAPFMPATAEKRLLSIDSVSNDTTPKKWKRHNSGKSPAKYPALGISVVKSSKTPNTTPTKVLNALQHPSDSQDNNELKGNKIDHIIDKLDLEGKHGNHEARCTLSRDKNHFSNSSIADVFEEYNNIEEVHFDDKIDANPIQSNNNRTPSDCVINTIGCLKDVQISPVKNKSIKLEKQNVNNKYNVEKEYMDIEVCKDEKLLSKFCSLFVKIDEAAFYIQTSSNTVIEKRIGVKLLKKNQLDKKPEMSYKGHALISVHLYWDKTNYIFDLTRADCPCLKILGRVLQMRDKTLVTFNIKEDLKLLYNCTKILVRTKIKDLFIADWLINPSDDSRSFKQVASDYLTSNKDFSGRMSHIKQIWALKNIISLKLKENQLHHIFDEIEVPLLSLILNMELVGIKFNRETSTALWKRVEIAMKNLEEEIYKLAGHQFNITSRKDINLMKNLLKITPENEAESEFMKAIHNWRKLSSLKARNLSQLLTCLERDERCRGISNMCTSTGRIVMHDPNLQHVARDFTINGEFFSARSAFIPNKGNLFLSADYSQLELRILAHFSQDKVLLNLINSDADIFISIAANWNNINPSLVTDELRQQTKQIIYGIIYGMGDRTLGDHLGETAANAGMMAAKFRRSYPGVQAFLKKCIKDCSRNGFITTITGRKRLLPAINSSNSTKKSQAERQAINSTIQGSAADIVKKAMIRIETRLNEILPERDNFTTNGPSSHLVLHIHDELLYEVSEEHLELVKQVVKWEMENSTQLSVRLPVVLKVGPSWGGLQKIRLII
ncbi:DNA polymerase theta-like [Cimex lectularius]|uniref:DNA-directed DNA polymerase n=1 Tax=Cimex lectularius TaxID=79782 RepID=A0A8I6SS74_CIMLE|nr:DNA polymerase theta-like [Cimex lectularius]